MTIKQRSQNTPQTIKGFNKQEEGEKEKKKNGMKEKKTMSLSWGTKRVASYQTRLTCQVCNPGVPGFSNWGSLSCKMAKRRFFNIIQANLFFKMSKDRTGHFKDHYSGFSKSKINQALGGSLGSPNEVSKECPLWRGLSQVGSRDRIDKIVDLDPKSMHFWTYPPHMVCCSLLVAPPRKHRGESPGAHWETLAGTIYHCINTL